MGIIKRGTREENRKKKGYKGSLRHLCDESRYDSDGVMAVKIHCAVCDCLVWVREGEKHNHESYSVYWSDARPCPWAGG